MTGSASIGSSQDLWFKAAARTEPGLAGQATASAGNFPKTAHQDAPHLDGAYAAFGKVTEGMDAVDAIAQIRTDYSDCPMDPQVMKKVTVETFGKDYPQPETL